MLIDLKDRTALVTGAGRSVGRGIAEVLASAGADELLGLVSSLQPLGTAGIVAAIAQLNDQAVVPVMLSLHRHLQAGHTLAESMQSVRGEFTHDPIEYATATSLLALGAA